MTVQLMRIKLLKYWNGMAPGSVLNVFPAVGHTLIDRCLAREIRRGRPKKVQRNGITDAKDSADD